MTQARAFLITPFSAERAGGGKAPVTFHAVQAAVRQAANHLVHVLGSVEAAEAYLAEFTRDLPQ
jgi:hypothetical protein